MSTRLHRHPALETTARVIWKVLTFPVFSALLMLAPVVYGICGLMMVGGILAAVLFEMSAVGPRFPFLQMVGIASPFGVFAALYSILVALIVKD